MLKKTLTRVRAMARPRVLTSMALVGAMTLQACGPAGGKVVDAANDDCARYRAPMHQLVNAYEQRFQEKAAASVAVGLIAGLAVGALTGNARAGVAVGAALGLSGLAGAYFEKKQSQARTKAALQSGIRSDIIGARREARSLSASITKLNQCRLRQIEKTRQLALGPNKAAAKTRVQAIRAWMEDDKKLIGQAVGELEEGADIYSKSYAKARDANVEQDLRAARRYTPTVQGGSVPTTKKTGRTVYATTTVNIRSGPGTNYGAVAKMTKGAVVKMQRGSAGGGGWAQIGYRDGVAYVSERYLSATPVASAPATLPKVAKKPRPKGNDSAALVMDVSEVKYEAETQIQANEARLDDVSALLA